MKLPSRYHLQLRVIFYSQWSDRIEVKHKNSCTLADEKSISTKKQKILGNIERFNKAASSYIRIPGDDVLGQEEDQNNVEIAQKAPETYLMLGHDLETEIQEELSSETAKEGEDRGLDGEDEPSEVEVPTEDMMFLLPSHLGLEKCTKLGVTNLVELEIQLREGQISDALEKLRFSLGTRSMLLRKMVRKADSGSTKTRAWKAVNQRTRERNLYVRIYCNARQALIRLGATELVETQYHPIKAQDLRVRGDIVEHNRYDQKSDHLPWFWRLKKADLELDSDAMKECK